METATGEEQQNLLEQYKGITRINQCQTTQNKQVEEYTFTLTPINGQQGQNHG